MLAERRQDEILKIVNNKGSITVAELTSLLNSSESTVRRDLSLLNELGKLNKVHGGATAIKDVYNTREANLSEKSNLYIEEKRDIARLAASLIKEDDFVYIDAGTTTEAIADFVTTKNTVFVTNGVTTAHKFAEKGFKVYILPGLIRPITEAVVGSEAITQINKYNFSKGFFGTNGLHVNKGYTTPDLEEARMKSEAIKQCKDKYVLADQSKFNKIFAVKFDSIAAAKIITTKLEDKTFKNHTTVLEVEEDDLHSNL